MRNGPLFSWNMPLSPATLAHYLTSKFGGCVADWAVVLEVDRNVALGRPEIRFETDSNGHVWYRVKDVEKYLRACLPTLPNVTDEVCALRAKLFDAGAIHDRSKPSSL
jgi:hypothetical protein